MNIVIFYYSKTGNTFAAAKLIQQGLQSVDGIQVQLVSVENEAGHDTLRQAQAVVFGSPTYSASFAWQLKRWYDEQARDFGLQGKLAANFITGNTLGGGQDNALASMASHEIMRGMLVYSGGGPLTHLGAVILDLNDEFQRRRAIEFGAGIGKMAKKISEK